MIKPICNFCDEELTEFGGILFDPPRADGFARKRHVCVVCMKRFDALAPEGSAIREYRRRRKAVSEGKNPNIVEPETSAEPERTP